MDLGEELINPSPVVHERKAARARTRPPLASGLGSGGGGGLSDGDDDALDDALDSGGGGERQPIDAAEVFEHVRDICDPEHPYTLEQLGVVEEDDISVDDAAGLVTVRFTPTVAHCSMAALIGLCIRVRLSRALPPRFKVDVLLTPGSHSTEGATNRQLNDKERVAAALETPQLLSQVNGCLQAAAAAAAEGGVMVKAPLFAG